MVGSIIPIIGIYMITIWKDILYSIYLMSICYFLLAGLKSGFKYSLKESLALGIVIALIFNYRHNGMLVAVMILFMVIALLIKYKSNMKRISVVALTFLASLLIISFPKNLYLGENNYSSNSINQFDNIKIWILSSHIKNNDVSKKDLFFLDQIINTDNWARSYSPYLINPIFMENPINVDFYIANKQEFNNLFFRYALKNPNNILKHYARSDALLYAPIKSAFPYALRET